jgi:hypothetical protein
VVEHLSSKHKTLSSNPRKAKKKKDKTAPDDNLESFTIYFKWEKLEVEQVFSMLPFVEKNLET